MISIHIKIIKKLGRSVFLLATVCSLLFIDTLYLHCSAESQVSLSQIMEKFPDGKYWNHAGSSKNNPDGYTDEKEYCFSENGVLVVYADARTAAARSFNRTSPHK